MTMPNPNKTSRLIVVTAVFALFAGCVIGRATANQPHMMAALDHLRSARYELVVAEANKGGHRENAIQWVDQAIAEVQRGINYAGN
jgi:hypothetical protein